MAVQDVQVNVWLMDASGNVGHAAVKVGGQYLDIWPKDCYKDVGFSTSFLPFKARRLNNVDEAVKKMGTAPDASYNIHVDETELLKIQQRKDALQSKIDEGRIFYTLLPQISPIRAISCLARGALNFEEGFPTGSLMGQEKHIKSIGEIYTHNCVSSVKDVLQEGPVKLGSAVITPNNLSDALNSAAKENPHLVKKFK